MWILLIPLIIAEIVFWIALAYFARRAFRAFKAGNRIEIAVWVGLILIPFGFYYYKHIEADLREAERAEEVAAFSHAAPAQPYPKFLEVYGHLTEFELLIILGELKFDEVAVLQRPRRGGIYGKFVTLAPGCEKLASEHLKTWKKRGRSKAPTRKDKDCLIGEWKTISDDRTGIAAVEYRHGTQSTLQLPGNSWNNGTYEVRVRTAEGSQLIDYWERPYITRPSWPGPWGYAYPSNTDSKKYKKPKRLDFFLKAIGEA